MAESDESRLIECLQQCMVELIDDPLISDEELLNFEQTVINTPNLDYLLTWWGDPFRAIALLKLLVLYLGKDGGSRTLSSIDALQVHQKKDWKDCPGIVHRGNLVVEGDLTWSDSSTLFVLGDLRVNGHYRDCSGVHIFVNGDMHAESIVTEGDLIVLGDMHVAVVLHAIRNDGTLVVRGDVEAPLFLTDDHLSIVGVTSGHYVSTADNDFAENLRTAVRDEYISEEGEVDTEVVVAQLCSGKRVLRSPGAAPWQHPRGLSPKFAAVGERLVAVISVGAHLVITSEGEHGNAHEGRVWRRDADGTWLETKKNSGSYRALFYSSNTLFIGGRDGVVETSKDLGDTWTAMTKCFDQDVRALAQSPDGTLFAAGSKGLVSRSKNDGATWENCRVEVTGVFRRPLQVDINDIHASGDDVWLCTCQGQLFRSSDLGDGWQQVTVGPSTALNRILSANGLLVVVGDKGVILTSRDGDSWKAAESGTTADIEDVIVAGDGIFYSVTSQGEILRSSEATLWNPQPSGLDAHLFSLCTNHDNALICVGANGAIVEPIGLGRRN